MSKVDLVHNHEMFSITRPIRLMCDWGNRKEDKIRIKPANTLKSFAHHPRESESHSPKKERDIMGLNFLLGHSFLWL